MHQLSAKVFKLSFEYLHIIGPKVAIFAGKNSKIGSLMSCQRSDLRKTLKYSQSRDLVGIHWILWIHTDVAPAGRPGWFCWIYADCTSITRARIEILDTVGCIEGVEGRGMGYPLLSRLEGLGQLRRSPSGVRGEARPKMDLVHLELVRTNLTTMN